VWEGEGRNLVSRKELIARAKWMRLNPTEAEQRLWSLLRNGRLARHRFRRQHIIFPYIVDFTCSDEVASAIYAALEDPHPPTAARRAPPSPGTGEGLGVANA
jgi:very-short-patch-repair endonuclease